jgi:probable HAF family extracellular repeat protein
VPKAVPLLDPTAAIEASVGRQRAASTESMRKGVRVMPKATGFWGASSELTILAAVLLALAYLVGVATRPADAAGPTRYEVTALDERWTGSIGRDINGPGQVAGQGQNPTGQARAFLWEGGVTRDLGWPSL